MLKACQFLHVDAVSQYEKYKQMAQKIMEEQQSAQEGVGGIEIQFNQDIFTAPNDSQMDTDLGGVGYFGGW